MRALDRFIQVADSIKHRIKNVARAADRLRVFYPQFTEAVLQRLTAADSSGVVHRVLRESLLDRYLVGVAEADTIVPQGYPTVQIKRSDRAATYAADQIIGLARARLELKEDLTTQGEPHRLAGPWLVEIAQSFLIANLQFSADETTSRRESALNSISPVRTWFRAGQRIVAKNEPVTRTHIEWLNALAQHRSESGT